MVFRHSQMGSTASAFGLITFLALLGIIIGMYNLDLLPGLSPKVHFTKVQVPHEDISSRVADASSDIHGKEIESSDEAGLNTSATDNGTSRDIVSANLTSVQVNNTKQSKQSELVSNNSSTNTKGTESAIASWLGRYNDGKSRPNVLFIIADDMRPDFKANAHEHSPWVEPTMVTPNLDALASKGLLFRRAYCQFAWCNPSRSSLLTSRRPDTTKVHNNSVFFRTINPDFVSLPQYFKENGFLTLGMGKTFHLMGLGNDHDEPLSWSEPNIRVRPKDKFAENGNAWQAVTPEEANGMPLQDEAVAHHAIKTLDRITEERKEKNQPFFLAVGIKKPHLNFVFPDRFKEYYPLENVSLPFNPLASQTLPDIAWFNSFEIRGRKEYIKDTSSWTKDHPLPDWIVKDLRRTYYSCITYIDDLIGQILKHLEDVGLANDTIVSFIGDHGFHLGEHSIVGKNTAFEVANNAPMIIRIPGVTDNGMVSDKLVEFVDLFPTLAELAGLPKVLGCPNKVESSRNVNLCTEGTSLIPVLEDPTTTNWKDRVFYQYPHYTGHSQHFCMGYSMRTAQYRYTEWVEYVYSRDVHADWTKLCAAELYDHDKDPHEMTNLADDPDLKGVRQDLSAKLKAGWFAALPQASLKSK